MEHLDICPYFRKTILCLTQKLILRSAKNTQIRINKIRPISIHLEDLEDRFTIGTLKSCKWWQMEPDAKLEAAMLGL